MSLGREKKWTALVTSSMMVNMTVLPEDGGRSVTKSNVMDGRPGVGSGLRSESSQGSGRQKYIHGHPQEGHCVVSQVREPTREVGGRMVSSCVEESVVENFRERMGLTLQEPGQ